MLTHPSLDQVGGNLRAMDSREFSRVSSCDLKILKAIPQHPIDDKSTLVEIKAWGPLGEVITYTNYGYMHGSNVPSFFFIL